MNWVCKRFVNKISKNILFIQGNAVIPKSVSKGRIILNMDVFDFKLTDEEIKDLSSFGHTERLFVMEDDKEHPEYPFQEG